MQAADCRVRKYGDGPRVFVGFHGWSGGRLSFEPLMTYLPDQSVFYAFDLPGAGESACPSRWTSPAVVQMLEEAVESLDIRGFELVTVCGGVGFGLCLAARRPDLVARLVMIDPFAFPPWFFRVFTLPWLGRCLYQVTFANPLGRWITDSALHHRRTGDSRLTDGFVEVRHRDNWGQLVAMCDVAKIPLATFGVFPGPVDIMYGVRTFRSVRTSVPLLHDVFPEAGITMVDGAGHLPVHEATHSVATVVYAEKS